MEKKNDGLFWTIFGLGILSIILWPIWFISIPSTLTAYICTAISYSQKMESSVGWARTVGLILSILSGVGFIMAVGIVILIALGL